MRMFAHSWDWLDLYLVAPTLSHGSLWPVTQCADQPTAVQRISNWAASLQRGGKDWRPWMLLFPVSPHFFACSHVTCPSLSHCLSPGCCFCSPREGRWSSLHSFASLGWLSSQGWPAGLGVGVIMTPVLCMALVEFTVRAHYQWITIGP